MITTENKTKEQVYREILEKIIAQGGKCLFNEQNSAACAYGDFKGRHCAIGWLLPPNNKALMNFQGALPELVGIGDLGPNTDFINNHFTDLRYLQAIHDRNERTELYAKESNASKALFVDKYPALAPLVARWFELTEPARSA